LELQLEINPTGDTTTREAQTIATLVRDSIARLETVSCVAPLQRPGQHRAKGSIVDSLQAFLVSVTPAGLRSVLSVVKSVATRPRQPKTIITVKSKTAQYKFEFDPSALSIQEIVDNVTRLPGLSE
jgi:hypothetical protein